MKVPLFVLFMSPMSPYKLYVKTHLNFFCLLINHFVNILKRIYVVYLINIDTTPSQLFTSQPPHR